MNWTSLEGFKTHIVAALIIVAAVVKHFGMMDEPTFSLLITVLTGAGFAALSSGANNAKRDLREVKQEVKANTELTQETKKMATTAAVKAAELKNDVKEVKQELSDSKLGS